MSVTMTHLKLGERIREVRLSKSMTQRDLSIASGITERAIGLLENGQPDARLSTVVDLARALGVSLDELIAEPSIAA